jgi:hypothetical protein
MKTNSSRSFVAMSELNDRRIEVRFQPRTQILSLFHSVQTGSGTKPDAYIQGVSGPFRGAEATEARNSIKCRV